MVASPTMTIEWNRTYAAPENWERHEPCSCGNCPECDEPVTVREPILLLDETSSGLCFTGEGVAVTMPDITTVGVGWCISFKNGVMTPSTFRTYESFDGGGVHFLLGGVECDSVVSLAPAGEICICYYDSTHWLVTGSARDGRGGPPS